MGAVTDRRDDKRLWLPLLMAGLLAGLALRLYLAGFAQTPGHGDSAFYYTVAKNIVDGRGPVIDYITYFFEGLLPLPHYAGDFWNPSAAYLVAIPIALFGKGIGVALLAGIFAGVVPAAAGYLAGLQFSRSITVGVLTAILTFFSPFEVWWSVSTEAIIFAGAFGSVALFLMMKAEASPRFFLLAALVTGLANMIRQDYVLMLGALEIWILLAALAWKRKLLIAAAALVIHLAVLSPLLIENYSQLHEVFPSGPGKTAFLTTYEDFHSYNKQIDWGTLRATWGIQGILKRRLHTATENLGQVEYFVDPIVGGVFLLALADLALLQRRLASLRPLLPVLIFALLEYLFYTFVASFSGPGSLIKCLASLMPFVSLVIVDWLASRLRWSAALVLAVAALSVYGGYQGFQRNYISTTYYNGVYKDYAAVTNMILADAPSRGLDPNGITVMARDTWDVYEGTGFKTVMIPNNDINTILFVAQHYNARYILLPGSRPQLDKIYSGSAPDGRFRVVSNVPGSDMKLFYLKFEDPG
jgi:hypothetical protein